MVLPVAHGGTGEGRQGERGEGGVELGRRLMQEEQRADEVGGREEETWRTWRAAASWGGS